MNKLVLIALVTLFAGVMADNYAVLVAGSNGYGNYRHQSDVCHAYHTLLAKGYSANNIIVFSYNDVANNKQNPFKGTLFNKPTYKNPGVDVNQGCVIDYEGKDVTPANYLAVLKGLKDQVKGGNKRVLESGPDDHVFLSFFDHGAPGLIAFPSQYLYAKDLQDAFVYMYNNNKYARLVYYLEACESGSMFQNLPANINIYALSAASPDESSWAAYCGSDAVVNNKNIGSCLGDLFSVNWLEDTDAHTDLSNYSLQEQFVVVKNLTTESQVMQWGDLEFTSEPVGDYLSGSTTPSKKVNNYLRAFFAYGNEENIFNQPKKGLLNSRQATLNYLLNKFQSKPTSENFQELSEALKLVEKFARKFVQFAEKFVLKGSSNALTTNFSCYSNLIDQFESTCGKVPESKLGELKYFYEFCGQERFSNVNTLQFFQSIC
ncbi:peptidase C13 family protein (macronuclear) [Tetrahymena thermophila SB210]|uniref:legumain n=1 Tax=Tetrahymena thermophila (strain SB210) TaxID=312017 RepID=I7M6Y2_TETTS|nr:peptidase C13 family protein [Tetrahymena thermophila SB210]EAR87482.1 peptidase C13 family protein [Tetrahymena thermophila SB210]|eukprot:XP_001007727.1 peptidase C13 family protein [Tetrahymena thermophila SB210]